jgi:4-phytase/acid phosphatase
MARVQLLPMVPKSLAFRSSLALLISFLIPATALRAQGADSEVKLVIVVSRHGVRTPLITDSTSGNYSAQAWPKWNVPTEYLTDHGTRQMALMGAYYRELFVQEGILEGSTDKDISHIFFRSDSDERTIETAKALARGLIPGGAADVRALPQGANDPLFKPATYYPGRVDEELAFGAVKGRMGGNPSVFTQSYPALFAELEYVLNGGDGKPPPGKLSVLDVPIGFAPGNHGEAVDMRGPLHKAENLIDAILLEYVEGMPMSDVGWGRVDSGTLTRLLQLHALYFDMSQRTFYPAQVQASNIASHLLDTLQQAVDGQPRSSAFGTPADRLVFVVGHDTTIANLGGLMSMTWMIAGAPVNPLLPGGALVFELRLRNGDGKYFVRTYYVSQTIEQMRDGNTLSLQNPPQIAPIFIPGCSESGPGYDSPFDRFNALLERVIDPKFVVPGSP